MDAVRPSEAVLAYFRPPFGLKLANPPSVTHLPVWYVKGTQLGEFEEIALLAIAILHHDAYGISILAEIKKQTKRRPSIGALHSALSRLEDKGFIKSKEGEETPERGGRRKRFYTITSAGIRALSKCREQRNSMWSNIPWMVLDVGKQ